MTNYLHARVCSLEPMGMPAYMRKSVPPAVILMMMTNTHTLFDYRDVLGKPAKAGTRITEVYITGMWFVSKDCRWPHEQFSSVIFVIFDKLDNFLKFTFFDESCPFSVYQNLKKNTSLSELNFPKSEKTWSL